MAVVRTIDEAEFGELVERVYDLALEPARLPELLQCLASAFGGHAGSFTRENMETGRGDGCALGLDPVVPGLYFDYYSTTNVLRRIENARERMKTFVPTVTVDEEMLPKRELVETEFYVDFLRPAGIHSVITIGLWNREIEFSGLDLYRPHGRPSFGEEEMALALALQPHLIRAFRLGARVAELDDLSQGLSAALDQSTFGVCYLHRDGALRYANALAERLLAEPGGLGVVMGRLTARHPADDGRLQAAIAAAAEGGSHRTGSSLLVSRPGDRSPLSVVVSPASADKLWPYSSGPGVIVCVTDPDATPTMSEARLRALYGLTPAQARVARALLEGRSLRETADYLGLSFFTARSHLASTFEKTGTRRQAELVALMTRAAASPF